MSKAVKIAIYMTVVKPVVVCGSETRAVSEIDMKIRSKRRRKYSEGYMGPWKSKEYGEQEVIRN
jgi:hypothetical protein